MFVKLPEWFKVFTYLGNHNPDWAFVRDEAGGWRDYHVLETKRTDDIDKLQWESEGWKIKFGQAHFDAIGVGCAFGKDPEALIQPALSEVLPIKVKPDSEVDPKENYGSHLPIYSLQAKAGGFSEGRDVAPEGWVEIKGRVTKGMFVSQVVGHFIEPMTRNVSSNKSGPAPDKARSC